MNRDDIIRMAREAGATDKMGVLQFYRIELEAFAALVAAAEREACAQIAETAFPFHCEDLIRARGRHAHTV